MCKNLENQISMKIWEQRLPFLCIKITFQPLTSYEKQKNEKSEIDVVNMYGILPE